MRLGVSLPVGPVDDFGHSSERLAEASRDIEEAGYDTAWSFDALAREFTLPDPLTTLAVAGAVTKRIELGTGILQVALRHPVELAQRVVTTQFLTGGRLILGVGAGSSPRDFEALGQDFEARFRSLSANLATMRRLWVGETVGSVSFTPWPAVHGGPPVLIGSWAHGKWIERAANEFNGWITSGAKTNWGTAEAGIRRFRALNGDRAVMSTVYCDPTVPIGGNGSDDPVTAYGRLSQIRDTVQRLADLGYDDVVLRFRDLTVRNLEAVRSLWP